MNETSRQHSISQSTFYKWKSKYGGLDVQQLSKMKELEKQLSQYKKDCCRTNFGNFCFKGCHCKKALKPCKERELVDYSKELHKVSLRKACKIFSLRSSVFYYRKGR